MTIEYGLVDESYKLIIGYDRKSVCDVKSSQVICAKNDWVAFQMILESQGEFLLQVSNETTLYHKGSIDQIRIEAKFDETLDVDVKLVGMVRDDDHMLKGDVLLDQKAILVKNKVQAVYFKYDMPADVEVGEHTISIKLFHKKLFEDECIMGEAEMAVEVVDYQIEDVPFHLDLWQHNSNIARQYQVELWSDDHFHILENYIQSLADLGQSVVSIVASEVPWSGQRSPEYLIGDVDLYEYNMVMIYKDKKGFRYDFKHVRRYIDLCMSYGIDQEIEIFGLTNIWGVPHKGYDNNLKLRYFDEDSKIFKYIKEQEDIDAYIKAVERFFLEADLIEITRVIADEPSHLISFTEKLNRLRLLVPDFKFKVALDKPEALKSKIDGVVDYVPVLSGISDGFDLQSTRRSFYVCCHPNFPNTFIGSSLVETRLIPWLVYDLNYDGFLRWNYTVWHGDHVNMSFRPDVWPAGDMNFVYPGKSGKPMLSLRYMSLLRGIRDFKILKSCQKTHLKTGFDYEAYRHSDYKSGLFDVGVDYAVIIDDLLKRLSNG